METHHQSAFQSDMNGSAWILDTFALLHDAVSREKWKNPNQNMGFLSPIFALKFYKYMKDLQNQNQIYFTGEVAWFLEKTYLPSPGECYRLAFLFFEIPQQLIIYNINKKYVLESTATTELDAHKRSLNKGNILFIITLKIG